MNDVAEKAAQPLNSKFLSTRRTSTTTNRGNDDSDSDGDRFVSTPKRNFDRKIPDNFDNLEISADSTELDEQLNGKRYLSYCTV